MRISEIVKRTNEKLAGETLLYSQLQVYFDEVIDDINTKLNSKFPAFSEVFSANDLQQDLEYNYFPDKYIRTVVIIGAAYKFYCTDEEGIATAQQYAYDYNTNLFIMERDYSNLVPDEYKADSQGYLQGNLLNFSLKDFLNGGLSTGKKIPLGDGQFLYVGTEPVFVAIQGFQGGKGDKGDPGVKGDTGPVGIGFDGVITLIGESSALDCVTRPGAYLILNEGASSSNAAYTYSSKDVLYVDERVSTEDGTKTLVQTKVSAESGIVVRTTAPLQAIPETPAWGPWESAYLTTAQVDHIIQDLSVDIENNSTKIAENNTDIKTLQKSASDLALRTTVNEKDISAVAHAVIEDQATLAGLSNRVSDNTNTIGSLTARISANERSIQDYADETAKQGESLASLEARVTVNELDIAQNKEDISKNSSDIATIQDDITSLEACTLGNKLAIKTDASGVGINITDAAQMPLESLNIYGKTNQVHTTGKNLFAFTEAKTITASGLTMTTGINNSYFDISGTATGVFSSEVLSCELPAGTYTMSMYGLVGVDDYVYLKNKNTNTIAVGTLKNGKTKSFTITETTSFAVAPVIRNTTPYTYNNTPVYIQIEQGDTATDYEPYSNGVASPSPEYPQPMETIGLSGNITINVDEQTLDVETPNGLPGIPASSNGNYTDENGQQWVCDEIDFEKGVYIKRINSYTITGVENWTRSAVQSSTDGNSRYDVTIAQPPAKGSNVLCNYYPYKGTNITSGIGTWVYNSSANYLNLRVVTAHVTATEFKNFLAEKYNSDVPVTIQYILAEPVETAIPDEVLAVYKELHTNKPTTYITNNANAYVKIGYIVDTKTYIDNKLKELQLAILSLGGNV